VILQRTACSTTFVPEQAAGACNAPSLRRVRPTLTPGELCIFSMSKISHDARVHCVSPGRGVASSDEKYNCSAVTSQMLGEFGVVVILNSFSLILDTSSWNPPRFVPASPRATPFPGGLPSSSANSDIQSKKHCQKRSTQYSFLLLCEQTASTRTGTMASGEVGPPCHSRYKGVYYDK
jgi:hypothetical protein